MNVKTLMRKLGKMPPDAMVGFASHDNSTFEMQGWAHSVALIKKEDADTSIMSKEDLSSLEDHPETWVAIRC